MCPCPSALYTIIKDGITTIRLVLCKVLHSLYHLHWEIFSWVKPLSAREKRIVHRISIQTILMCYTPSGVKSILSVNSLFCLQPIKESQCSLMMGPTADLNLTTAISAILLQNHRGVCLPPTNPYHTWLAKWWPGVWLNCSSCQYKKAKKKNLQCQPPFFQCLCFCEA